MQDRLHYAGWSQVMGCIRVKLGWDVFRLESGARGRVMRLHTVQRCGWLVCLQEVQMERGSLVVPNGQEEKLAQNQSINCCSARSKCWVIWEHIDQFRICVFRIVKWGEKKLCKYKFHHYADIWKTCFQSKKPEHRLKKDYLLAKSTKLTVGLLVKEHYGLLSLSLSLDFCSNDNTTQFIHS